MSPTENDLRVLLTERAEGRDVPVRLDEIVRRGRGVRRRRGAAGTVLAGAAVAAVVAVVIPFASTVSPATPGPDVAQPANSARIESGPELPEKFEVRLGALIKTLSLIHSERFETTGSARTITFTPTGVYTGYKVVCTDPMLWVLTSTSLKSGENGGSLARCGEIVGTHHDEKSAPEDWLTDTQSMKVWVFPADAPIMDEPASGMRGECAPEVITCGGRYTTYGLFQGDGADRLAAEMGERLAPWAVGVYDDPVDRLRSAPRVTHTVTPSPGPSRPPEPNATHTVTLSPVPSGR
jgi:hypothetical protein